MARTCTVCGKRAYSDYCVQHKPRKPLNPIGKRGKQNATTTKKFKATLDPTIKHECYLKIHPYCPIMLTIDEVTPEHVKSKSGSPHLRDDLTNILVSCHWCNSLKGSRSLESLSTDFPHLQKYL